MALNLVLQSCVLVKSRQCFFSPTYSPLICTEGVDRVDRIDQHIKLIWQKIKVYTTFSLWVFLIEINFTIACQIFLFLLTYHFNWKKCMRPKKCFRSKRAGIIYLLLDRTCSLQPCLPDAAFMQTLSALDRLGARTCVLKPCLRTLMLDSFGLL